MKSKIFILSLCVGFTLSLYTNFRLWRSIGKHQAQNTAVLEAVKNGGNAPLLRKRKADNDSGATVHSFAEIRVNNVDVVKQAATGNYIDTVAAALKVALGEIAELKHINAAMQARLKLTRTDGDTARIATMPLSYQSKYLSLQFNPMTDSLSYTYNIVLNAARHKRGNIWDIYSPDPNVRINNFKTFTIDAREQHKRLGIGLQAGYGYTITGLTPYLGVGINYNLIEF